MYWEGLRFCGEILKEIYGSLFLYNLLEYLIYNWLNLRLKIFVLYCMCFVFFVYGL